MKKLYILTPIWIAGIAYGAMYLLSGAAATFNPFTSWDYSHDPFEFCWRMTFMFSLAHLGLSIFLSMWWTVEIGIKKLLGRRPEEIERSKLLQVCSDLINIDN